MSWFHKIVIVSSLPVILAASWLFYPAVFDGPTVCLLKLTAGLPCFACGLTRAFACMVHGEFARMLIYHPLAPVVLVWIVCAWALEVRDLRRTTRTPMPLWFQRFGHAVVFLMIGLWCTRMTVFFASPGGVQSMLTKNLIVRLIRLDFSNSHEVFVDTRAPRP